MICNLCPRRCAALRTDTRGEGRCAMPSLPVVARAALHQWEEPPLSGARGAGTVFFSGCPLGCVFCQNESISHENFGRPISVERLRAIFQELIDQGAHNIDLVNPTHFAHAVLQALEEPLPVPVVWNSGGYDTLETLRALEGKVDVYLPDLKYADQERALRYSGAADYFPVAAAAIREMVRQVGLPVFDKEGMLQKGVVIRHLVLPGGMKDSMSVLDWVARSFRPGEVLISLMSQYTPFYRSREFQELGRRVSTYEYNKVAGYMMDLGLTQGFMQERSSAKEEYTPEFALQGVFAPASEEKRDHC